MENMRSAAQCGHDIERAIAAMRGDLAVRQHQRGGCDALLVLAAISIRYRLTL
jgi:hypothetical protein